MSFFQGKWLCECTLSGYSSFTVSNQRFATPELMVHQGPLSMEFSRQECWGGLPFPSPGDLPDPGIKPTSLASPALAGGFFTSWGTGEAPVIRIGKSQPFLFWIETELRPASWATEIKASKNLCVCVWVFFVWI